MVTHRGARCGVIHLVFSGLLLVLVGCGPLIDREPATPEAIDRTQVWIENTHLMAYSSGSNIAWSNSGDLLAYIHLLSIWIVPDGRWSEASEVYTRHAVFDSSKYTLYGFDLAWSPDDTALGFTLFGYVENELLHGTLSRPRLTRLDWREGTASFISEEEAQFTDWSTDNLLLTRRDGGCWVLDVSSGEWWSLSLIDRDGTFAGYPHWSHDGAVIFATFPDWRAENGTISIVDWRAGTRETISTVTGAVRMASNMGAPSTPLSSPDGRWIAWIEAEHTEEEYIWRIMLYDRERSEVSEIANNMEYDSSEWEALTWSPDSRKLAFRASRGEEDYVILILHLE
jgi:hypothetical protein